MSSVRRCFLLYMDLTVVKEWLHVHKLKIKVYSFKEHLIVERAEVCFPFLANLCFLIAVVFCFPFFEFYAHLFPLDLYLMVDIVPMLEIVSLLYISSKS